MIFMKSKIKVKLLTALVLFGTVAAYAGTTGKIKGKVLDSRISDIRTIEDDVFENR